MPPDRPPPQRRAPTVATPASTASSRKSEAACIPARERASSCSTPTGASDGATSSGSAGPPRPIATTTTSRPAACSSRAACAETAVLPTRLPVPIDRQRRVLERLRHGRTQLEVGALVGQPGGKRVRGQPQPPFLAQHRLVGQVEHAVRAVAGGRLQHRGGGVAGQRLQRHAVLGSAGQLLGAAQQQCRDDVGRRGGLLERSPHHLRVVLAVDQREHPWAHQRLPRWGGCFS